MSRKNINIAIIGVGFIGGSLGMALRRAGGYRVTGIGRDMQKLRRARRLGAIDAATTDFAEGLTEADIAVLCTPVDVIAATVWKMLPFLKDGAVITDAGSIKGAVHRGLEPPLARYREKTGKRIFYVGGHPMAGSEKTGVAFADGLLYRGASVVVSVERGTPKRSVDAVRTMWRRTGARVMAIDPIEHDRMVAYTSHLPHVLAFGLCRVLASVSKIEPRTKELMAGSFRDMTRIADSNPRDWAAICSGNGKELAAAIDRYMRELANVRKIAGNARALEKAFSEARSARNKLLHP